MIVVTGATGLLGMNFVKTALSHNRIVVGTCHKHVFDLPGVEMVQVDLRDGIMMENFIQYYRPQWVVHCAALTNVDWCEGHPTETWQVNVEMSHSLSAVCGQVGAKFVYISTDSVFDGEKGNYTEEDSPAPINRYAESKLAGEEVVLDELDHCMVIRTNIYGWNLQDKFSLAEWILSRLESDNGVPGFYDVVFTPILVNELSEVILKMMDLGLNGIYNVAAAQPCTKYEFALKIADIFDLKRDLIHPESIGKSKLQAARPRNTSLQTEKVSSALCRSMPDVEAGLKQFRKLQVSGYADELKTYRVR